MREQDIVHEDDQALEEQHEGEPLPRGRFVAAVEKERCTALYGVPTMFNAELNLPNFVEYDLGTLRTFAFELDPSIRLLSSLRRLSAAVCTLSAIFCKSAISLSSVLLPRKQP